MGGTATGQDLIESGWDALRVGEWVRAKECFEHALSAGPSAEAYEGLGWAAYCLDEDPLTFDAREQAYRLYRVRGDDQSAARVAAWLAAAWYEFRGEPAVGNGWLRRAHRLLDPVEPGVAVVAPQGVDCTHGSECRPWSPSVERFHRTALPARFGVTALGPALSPHAAAVRPRS